MKDNDFSMASRSRHCVTIRRVIILAVIFIVLRIIWMSIATMLKESDPLDVGDLPPNMEFDRIFEPKECIIGANNTCVPVEADDIYLGRGLYAHQDKFYLDGRPFRILSGSFHYFRTQPIQWGDRLLKMKAAGLNTIMTYVPWNLQEPYKGEFMFGGDRDLASFIKQAQKVGLKVIVRPGPYICAEWEFGGLPSWLLKDPDMRVRTSYAPYLRHVEEYFSKLLYILAPLAYKKGGPVIAFQVENEYGSYGDDTRYLQFLVDQFKKWSIEELLFTSDGTKPEQLSRGSIPGLLATANFKNHYEENLKKLKLFQPDKPLMVTEFWCGWFDHWGEEHHNMTEEVYRKAVQNILKHGASINFYMFTGGTNFGFWNGANFGVEENSYAPTITSYDYDAPIAEDGRLTKKYFITREILSELVTDREELPDISTVVRAAQHAAYGMLRVTEWLSYFTLTEIAHGLSSGIYGNKTVFPRPVTMETLDLRNGCGQNFGWLLYRTWIKLSDPQLLTLKGTIHDRAQFLVNSQEVAVYYRNDVFPQVMLPPQSSDAEPSTLDILVENMGRVNFNRQKILDREHKGINGEIRIGPTLPSTWHHIPLDFDEEFISTVSQHDNWQTYVHVAEGEAHTFTSGPCLYRMMLNLDVPPADTYIDMKGWTKGIVIVNGFILGRYWHLGPQRTLYVPASLLVQGRNVIIVFELHKAHDSVTFTDTSILDDRW